jgi:hypothetical protein
VEKLKKGFIFSLSTFYYVLLFLVFLSLFILSYVDLSYKDRVDDFSYSKKINLFTSDGLTERINNNEFGWCAVYYVYNPNQDLRKQSLPERRNYCESYVKERVF